MTIIQPNRTSNTLNWVLWTLTATVMLSAVWLVIAYNQVVNLSHTVAETKARIAELNAQNAELKEQAFAMLDAGKFEKLALDAGFVQDKSPVYFEVNSQWALASASQY